jgi:uncharacterized protein YndB with AHSA1/START domain
MIVEREVLIDAPAEVVWSIVTEPHEVRRWFADEAEFEASPGSLGKFVFKDNATGATTTVHLQVEEVRPPELFSFRWVYPDGAEPVPGNSLLTQFTLHAEGHKTRLRVVESGLDEIDWSEEARANYVTDHSRGWQQLLGALQDYVAATVQSAQS